MSQHQTQLRLAYVNWKPNSPRPDESSLNTNTSPQPSKMSSLSSCALQLAKDYDRLTELRPNAGAVILRLVSNLLDDAEGRKL